MNLGKGGKKVTFFSVLAVGNKIGCYFSQFLAVTHFLSKKTRSCKYIFLKFFPIFSIFPNNRGRKMLQSGIRRKQTEGNLNEISLGLVTMWRTPRTIRVFRPQRMSPLMRMAFTVRRISTSLCSLVASQAKITTLEEDAEEEA